MIGGLIFGVDDFVYALLLIERYGRIWLLELV